MSYIFSPDFIQQLKQSKPRVLDADFPLQSFLKINLSADNPDLARVDVSSSEALGNYIFGLIDNHSAKVGFGGYLEVRSIYNRSEHFNSAKDEERNIHLGLDIWVMENTAVVAPWNGVIHSFQNNEGFGNYGPTIILKHQINGVEFYSLYGHLTLSSLVGLKNGKAIKKNEIFAKVGDAEVNGDYPPHLHFQLILDVENYKGDYPGVAGISKLEYYKSNCPDPTSILGLD